MPKTKPTAKVINLSLYLLFILTLCFLALGQLLRINLPKGAIYPHDFSILLFMVGFFISQRKKFVADLKKIRLVNKTVLRKYSLEIIAGLWVVVSLTYQIIIKHNLMPLIYDLRIIFYATFTYLTYLQLKKWRRFHQLNRYHYFLMVLGFIALFGLIQYLLFFDTRVFVYLGWDDHLGRLISTLLDPNFAGFLIGLGLIYWQSLKPKLKSWQYLSVNLGFILALTLTFSRASYLVVLVSLGLITWLSRQKTVKLASFFSLSLLLASIYFIPKPPGEGGKLWRSASIKARVINDFKALNLPINFKQLKQQDVNNQLIQQKEQINQKLPNHAHWPNNLEVLIYHQLGLIGLILFLGVLLKWGKRLYLHNKLAGVLLLGLLLHAQFNNTAFEPFVFLIFWGSLTEVLRFKLDI